MRKLLWISLMVLFVVIGAPNAYADETPTFTCIPSTGFTCLSTPKAPAGTFPDLTLNLTWDTLSVASMTLSPLDSPSDTYTWFMSINGPVPSSGGWYISTFILDTTTGAQSYYTNFYTPICPGCTPTTEEGFSMEEEGTLSFAPAKAPEPSSVALMLFGVGLVFVMRKRIGQRLPQDI